MDIRVNFIKEFILRQGISKNEFCKKCKISSSTLNKILSNNQNLGIIALFKVARGMNVQIKELFTNHEDL
jgi:transcriptional regulator with XRE-family HTH domain